MKFAEKIQAIKLRKEGASYAKIRGMVPVSKSTLSLWLRGIELSKKQQRNLLKGLSISRYAAASKKKLERTEKTKRIIGEAKKEFLRFVNNPLFNIGLSLYLAEGDKNILERVKFSNSDPKLISLMMIWFRKFCEVPESKFRIAVHIHNLQSDKEAQQFWSSITKIKKEQFYAIYIKKSSLKTRRNVLYHGTCSIVINSRDMFRRIMGWRAGLFDYFSI